MFHFDDLNVLTALEKHADQLVEFTWPFLFYILNSQCSFSEKISLHKIRYGFQSLESFIKFILFGAKGGREEGSTLWPFIYLCETGVLTYLPMLGGWEGGGAINTVAFYLSA